MTDATLPQTTTGRADLNETGSRRATTLARLAIGLIQGIALWWLFQAQSDDVWPSTDPALFWPLVLTLCYLPIVLLAGVGRMRLRTLVIWGVSAATALMLLAWHDIARQSGIDADTTLAFPIVSFAATALFITHHMILPADRARRWIAPYPAYFDAAWLAGVQLVLSIGFTAVFWLLLFLGAALFGIIGLDFLKNLIDEPWFAIPVTTLTFAVAVQLTDVRDGLIRGVRTVALMLLSWLLLVLTVLVAGFLAALPFTGLDGLWDTGSATALVLAATGGLIILINTAYQDGRPDNLPPTVLRIAVRVASVLLTPLIVIAIWGLSLRIGQHGLTPDRIIALACAIVGAAYAVGYTAAALLLLDRTGPWMRALEPTNIATAILQVAVILLLFSPLADPARLSVADQMARLERGAVTPEAFDYDFLHFESGRAGQAALDRLTRSTDPEIARRASNAQTSSPRIIDDPIPRARTVTDIRISANPSGTTLPASFTGQFDRLIDVLDRCTDGTVCQARLLDLDQDGTAEVLVGSPQEIMAFRREEDGRWMEWANYHPPLCAPDGLDVSQPVAEGRVETAAPAFPDLVVGGVHMRTQLGDIECPLPAETRR